MLLSSRKDGAFPKQAQACNSTQLDHEQSTPSEHRMETLRCQEGHNELKVGRLSPFQGRF